MKALFLISTNRASQEWLPIAREVAKRGGEPVYATLASTPRTENDTLTGAGVRILELRRGGGSAGEAPRGRGLARRLPRPVREALLPAARAALLARGLSRARRLAAETLRRERPTALVVANDRSPGVETAFIAAARKLEIPVVLAPDAIPSVESAVDVRRASPGARDMMSRSWWHGALARRYPGWVVPVDGGTMFFLPPEQCLVSHAFGMMPARPWMLGGGDSTVVLAECEVVRDRMIAAGVDASKIRVTGRPKLDEVVRDARRAETERKATRRSLGVGADRPIVVCSLPPYAEHGYLPWEDHWREIDFLLQALCGTKEAAIVLSLHPRMDPEHYAERARNHGATIASRGIYELVSACDVFVAEGASTTILAALAAESAVVALDYAGLARTYDESAGITFVTRETLASSTRALALDPAQREAAVDRQRRGVRRWALLDGRNAERAAEEIIEATQLDM